MFNIQVFPYTSSFTTTKLLKESKVRKNRMVLRMRISPRYWILKWRWNLFSKLVTESPFKKKKKISTDNAPCYGIHMTRVTKFSFTGNTLRPVPLFYGQYYFARQNCQVTLTHTALINFFTINGKNVSEAMSSKKKDFWTC